MELNSETKLEILKQKIESYYQQIYSYKIDLRVAEALEDTQLKERVIALTTRAMTAIEILEEEFNTLQPTKV